jgi:TRAP-type C4-dicarboxylate transport system substrate-binding protein
MRARVTGSTFTLLAGVTAAAVVASSAVPAAAQDKPTEMKFAFWVPAAHPLAKLGYEPWAKSVEAASKGSIKVPLFPAQQLGKAPDHYDMARDGIAELTWVNPGYQAGRFPVFAAGELPFLMSDQGGGSAALDAWYRKYAAKEMGDVHFCFAHLHIGTLHSKVPITDPGQIKGMKIRPANGTVAQLVSTLGGTSVQLTAPEARDALEKGLADAITFPWKSIVTPFGIDKVVKFHADMQLYQATFVWVMNKGWYGKLSADRKKVIDDHCTNAWAQKLGVEWGKDEDSGKVPLSKDGHTIVKLTPEQLAAWKKAAAPVYDKWLADANKAGYDGKAVLEELRAELKKRNALQ